MAETNQTEQIQIDDYKNALRGEICDLIGHNPDADELAQMEFYASDYFTECENRHKAPNLAGLACALLECKQEQFKQCAECGECFLPGEINQDTGEHCLRCKPYLDPDIMPGGWDDMKAGY